MEAKKESYGIWTKPSSAREGLRQGLTISQDTQSSINEAFQEELSEEEKRPFSSYLDRENLSKIMI